MGFYGLFIAEMSRIFRKKSFYVLLVLVPLPVAVSFFLSSSKIVEPVLAVASAEEKKSLWLVFLGVNMGGAVSMLMHLVSLGTVSTYAWLFAALFGGDLYASDARDGLMALMLVRPVRRSQLALAKLFAVFSFLAIFYALSAFFVYLAAWIMAGAQEYAWMVPVYGLLLALGSLPLLLLSSIIGFSLRSPVLGILLGIVAYFLSGVAVSIPVMQVLVTHNASSRVAVVVYGEAAAKTIYYGSFNPLSPVNIANYASMILVGLDKYTVATGFMARPIELSVETLLANSLASWGFSLAVLAALLLYYFHRRDF